MSKRKLRGLFINNVEAQCSIYESGKMAYDCLVGSDKYSLDYVEITRANTELPADRDFYFFNHHFSRWYWLNTKHIRRIVPGVTFTMVLEIAPNDPFVYCSPDDFDAYIVLDPTLNLKKEHVYPFPRPLEVVPHQTWRNFSDEVPVIGSFGFGTPGKGFEHVVDAVNREFDRAIVRLNIPRASYWDQDGSVGAELGRMCTERAKDGIEVIVTHDFLSKEELIRWCGENTINVFLYDRNQPGLSATTDQAITSGRPMITSKNNTFRHIQQYIRPFPYQTLREAIEKTPAKIAELQHDWSPFEFRAKFEQVLDDFQFAEAEPARGGTVRLKVKPANFIQEIRNKAAVKTRFRKLLKIAGIQVREPAATVPEISYSQFGEDKVIYDLLKSMSVQEAAYLDIGANDPKLFSNTFMFYELGHRGVLVEPNPSLSAKLEEERPADIVLNAGIGIGGNASEADFYLFSGINNGLSTFSADNARFMEEVGLDGMKRAVDRVLKMPLLDINDVIANNFTECPDIVSIDVEGWDLKILQSLDFDRYNPAVFCVETLAYGDGGPYRVTEIYDFLESKGYFPFKDTEANTIFVNRNLYDFYLYQSGRDRASVSARAAA